jgi:hypothetical protein
MGFGGLKRFNYLPALAQAIADSFTQTNFNAFAAT